MIEHNEQKTKDKSFEDEIDLIELFKELWGRKIFIILFTGLVAISSIFYALALTKYYTSESLLTSRESQDSGSMSQFSGMTSLIGLSLAGANNGDATEIIEIIKSREFVKHLISFDNVLPSLLAVESYDSSSEKLYFDSEVYDSKTKRWLRYSNDNKESKPSYLEAHRAYSEMLDVSQDKITGLITLKFEHVSPFFAKEFLSLIIQQANNLNRKRDIENTNKAIIYFEKELSRTSLVEIRESINQLIESQLETKMMANVYNDYTLITIEPPFVPDKRSRPSRSFIVIFSTLLGGLISILIVITRYFIFLNKEND